MGEVEAEMGLKVAYQIRDGYVGGTDSGRRLSEQRLHAARQLLVGDHWNVSSFREVDLNCN